MTDREDGRFGCADRATHEQSPQAVSAVPVGIPSAMGMLCAVANARYALEFWHREACLAAPEASWTYRPIERGLQECATLAGIERQLRGQFATENTTAGPPASLDVEDAISEWHLGAGPGVELHAFLGWTWEEYVEWARCAQNIPQRPLSSAAAQAIEARRAETRGGSVEDESAVGDSRCAPTSPSGETRNG